MTRKQPQPSDAPHQPAKAKTKTDLLIEEHAARLAAAAPPLSDWQRTRLADIFANARNGHRPSKSVQ